MQAPNSRTNWIFIPVLLALALGCAFVQDRLSDISGQETEAEPTPGRQADDTPAAATLTSTGLTTQLSSTELRSPDDFSSLASALEWTYSGGYTSLRVPVSGDLQAAEAMLIPAASLAPPETCLQRQDCRQAVAIEISPRLSAVSCNKVEQVLWKEVCAEVSLPAGARFRMMGILYDTHPGQWNYIPILQLLPASDVPCLEGELRCQSDSTCFASFDDYCRTCLGLAKERCACQSPQGNLPNGSDCEFWLSGDVLQAGKCWWGVCR